jgi:hypothetical protein
MHLNKTVFMKRTIMMFFCLLPVLYLLAQQPVCNDETIMHIKGSWKRKSDAGVKPNGGFPNDQLQQVSSRIDKMEKLLQAAYPEPMGIEAGWYPMIGGGVLVKDGPVPYGLQSLFLAYYCNSNKIDLGDETGTWFYVWANQFNWFAEYIKNYTIQQQPVYLLTQQLGEFKGYPVYGGVHSSGLPGTRISSNAIMITRRGQSPYLPVTRKQFLDAFLNDSEAGFQKTLSALEKNIPVKTNEEEEAYKKNQLAIIERVTTPSKIEKAKDNFLQHYITDKQRKEDDIAKIKRGHAVEIKPAQDFLASSPEQELKQAAMINFTNLLAFKEFSTAEKGGRQLVRVNPDYFDSKLPKYVPQFLIVYWRWDKEKPAENFKKQVEDRFNFYALEAMIDQ